MSLVDLTRLENELDRLQARETGASIVLRAAPIGLGGQITGRVEMLMLGLALDRQAVFPDNSDFPYGQTFLSMSTQDVTGLDLDRLPLLDLDAAQDQQTLLYDPLQCNVHDHYDRLLGLIKSRLSVRIGSIRTLTGALLKWMRVTPDAERFVVEAVDRLGVGEDVLGVHLRRGDKKVETPVVPPAEFNRCIAQLHARWPFRAIYLASDSPDAATMITPPTGVTLIFDEEKRFNNANHKMLLRTPALVEQETRVAYKNIAILSLCGGVIGQDNAHFATLAASAIALRTGREDTICLLDGGMTERQSRLASLLIVIKRQARRMVLRLFPGVGTAARARRKKAAIR